MISKEIAQQIADELGYSGKPIQFKVLGQYLDSSPAGFLYIGYWTLSASAPQAVVELYYRGNLLNTMYCAVDANNSGSTAQWFGVTDQVFAPNNLGTAIVTFCGWVVAI